MRRIHTNAATDSLSRYSGRGLGWGFDQGAHPQSTPSLTLPRSTGGGKNGHGTNLVLIALVIAAFLPALTLAAPADPPKPLAADANVDQVLDALDQRGKSLKEFTADVKLTEETDPAFGISTVRTGKVAFQRKSDDDARIRVTFEKKIKGTKAFDDRKEYLLDNGVLTDRDYPNKIEVRRRVMREGQKMNLLKLGEGPFPLPIGQNKEDVHKNFDVVRPPPRKDDPQGTIHLTLKPKPGSSMARRIASLDVWVDQKTNMPVRIDTTDAASAAETRKTELSKLVVNPQPPLKDADFTLPNIDQATWSIKTESLQE
jgi:outer membrane lipoprotein-sorting protein